MEANSLPTVLGASEGSVEYVMGARAAACGLTAKSNPFKPGSKPAMRWTYGCEDMLAVIRFAARRGVQV